MKPPLSSKKAKKDARRASRASAEAREAHEVHKVHILEEAKAFRSRDFDARQEIAHIQAAARKLQQKIDNEKRAETELSKDEEVALHRVPSIPIINGNFIFQTSI